MKFKDDKQIQIKHLSVDEAFRLHGFYEDGTFYVIAIDPTHEDSKN